MRSPHVGTASQAFYLRTMSCCWHPPRKRLRVAWNKSATGPIAGR